MIFKTFAYKILERRAKLDPNRELDNAAQGNPLAEEAWKLFHGYIDKFSEEVQRGIMFDMHGQVGEIKTTQQYVYIA